MEASNLRTKAIIGLEIHVQLLTDTKLFCACPVRFEAAPNSCVCEVCLGHPGALPVLNRRAFEHALLTGLALNCEIAPRTKWDRKSYYYPDLPKNYQISQYDLPLAEHGYVDIEVNGQVRRIRILRTHLEEDAGKNIHDASGCTLVDLNRAGTPLLEIVTEPDLTSAEEAFIFCTELQRLVTYLGVTEGSMQKGQMRFEPNVNVAIEVNGKEHRTPISEIKNINSFRFVRQAIEYEIERQIAAWQADHDYLIGQCPNENRGWNADQGVTEFQRDKEAAHDYRYFPDPDLAAVQVSPQMLERARSRLGELPIARRKRFVGQYGLSGGDAQTIVAHRATADFFEDVVAAGAPTDIAGKQFVNVWLKLAHDRGDTIDALGVEATRMADLAKMTGDGTVSKTSAKQIAEMLVSQPESPRELAKQAGLVQERDADATQAWVEKVFADNDQAVRDALVNPKKAKAAAGFLCGQVMKVSNGKADPKLVGELIERRLADMNRS
ncbi:MAG: Asp-tRNA(Asn)/Glu-tRNA(Gln) amidotransferase subunit GatB [Planctomycetes bacterium]|nr:Asp-tRNA(Asn)/Glu-tRNA(Gln) amidotransferase subunit GatB [Planctomycetota bacterium]